MDAINTLRTILAAGAVLAAVVAALTGRWLTVAILAAAVGGHLWLWVRLYRDRHPAPAVPPGGGGAGTRPAPPATLG